ncbi:acyl-CoA N-acyltransferase [Lasiosphaeris hirsuta]|uniref:N-alpha-acetyltransferase 40 n=1 Tax=Lasiosphaeris hirsuta TaxID=260670 RepID=A0AA40E1P6_9PEZI|nr:acyl-CoA N-acyltransferase [Lasiosphaeris hirsuta]
MTPKRKRAPPNPLELANKKSDEQFIADYLQPGTKDSPWITKWTHPRTSVAYSIRLAGPGRLSEDELRACFSLIEETSRQDYESSAARWHPAKKLKEMASPDLRYILVRDQETHTIRGFTSLMPTYEEGQPVIYCYEIHLKPELQGTGLGSLLMSFHTTVAANIPIVTKVMLTCFLANQRGVAFYSRLGFEKDEISPVPRKLRYGKVFTPDYVIMSKRVRSDEPEDDSKPPE